MVIRSDKEETSNESDEEEIGTTTYSFPQRQKRVQRKRTLRALEL